MTKISTFTRRARYFILKFVLMAALTIAAVSIAPEYANAETISLNSAINKAGRQRMLSQRMAKAYYQIGLNTRRDEATKVLEQSVQLFEAQLAELTGFTPNRTMADGITVVKAKWAPFKAIVTRPYNRDGAARLVELNEDLLQAAHKVVVQLQEYSGKPSARLVNIAGRQRMLSQRLAKFYMLRQAGFEQAEILKNMDQVYNEFGGALVELRAAPQNTPEITTHLNSVNIQWVLLKESLKDANKQHDLSELVVLTTDKILKEMDTVTGIYEATQ